jgi:hypothetical protein
LDLLNDRLALEDRQLHPTKGFRKINPKRTRAALITDNIKSGHIPYKLLGAKQSMEVWQ